MICPLVHKNIGDVPLAAPSRAYLNREGSITMPRMSGRDFGLRDNKGSSTAGGIEEKFRQRFHPHP